MTAFRVFDWDDAYTNGANIAGGDRWPEAWAAPAAAYRLARSTALDINISYGAHERQRYDLFYPDISPLGLFVFVHGGYWMALNKSYWSHLAQGAIVSGWAVAIPSYVLCPEAGIGDITQMIADAVEHAAQRVNGPIVLSGHSAGGHLVTSLLSKDSPLTGKVQDRVTHTVSLSGIHDLRPLLKTTMNETLRLNDDSASLLSPALMAPVSNCRVTAWVGGGERAEFIRQSQLLSNIWHGLGATTQCITEPDKHHFNVVDGLSDTTSPLVKTALDMR